MCGFVREVDRENEEREERKALESIIEEHKRWAKIFGEALILALQGDCSEIDKLARQVSFEFLPDGEPVLKSQALALARKAGIKC